MYNCSPGTDWGDIACYLGPNGNIFEDINFYVDSVKDSYGSPVTTISNFTQIVYPNGILNNGSYGVDNSYGSPDIRYTPFWWVDISGAPDSYLHNDVSYSYGNIYFRRTRVGIVMLIMFIHMVALSATLTTTMSAIPTALR